MSSLNKVMLIGNLGKDPELRYTPSGVAVSEFSIATSKTWKDDGGERREKTTWHNIVAWRKLAEIIGEYVKKGNKIFIEGELETQIWEKDGVKQYKTVINATNVVLLDKKITTQGGQPQSTEASQTVQAGDTPKDDDLPFIWLLPLIPMLGVFGEALL